jgi:FkbM family methyltransferase
MSSNFQQWVIDFKIPKSPLIHIGAHLVQERDDYQDLGFTPVVWFEAQPLIAKKAQEILSGYQDQKLVTATLWSKSGLTKSLFIAGPEGSSSSILEPHLITASHPNVYTESKIEMLTSTLDEELKKLQLQEKYGIIILDVQGAEIEVLRGSSLTLNQVDYIISEVSILELYKNTAKLDELTQYLAEKGFAFIGSDINIATGWGEGLFIHRRVLEKDPNITPNHKRVGKRYARGRIFRTFIIKLGLSRALSSRKSRVILK